MDVETGETACNRDNETGEWLPNENEDESETETEYNNEETGEQEIPNSNRLTHSTRSTFKIPKSLVNATKKEFWCGESARDMSPALLFLLPTLFVYPGVTSIIVAILEVIIHTWAHRINKKLANKSVYYKSPMHVIASEFCAKCRDIKSMDKIEKIQDKRTHKVKCNYEYAIKRIVT